MEESAKIEVPEKREVELFLFSKYRKWLHSEDPIPQDVIEDYLRDLKTFNMMY